MANWIKNAIRRPGQLHRDLGVPQGQRIPASTLASAAQRPGKVGQRARFAQTLRGFADGGMVGDKQQPSTAAHARFRNACKGM